MNSEKSSKIQLFLIEAVILMVVFAIASTFIVTIFIKGNEIRIKADRLNEAVIYGQNVAESIRENQDVELLSSDALIAEVDSEIKTTELGQMTYYQIKIKDRHTSEVIYEIETGIYDDEN